MTGRNRDALSAGDLSAMRAEMAAHMPDRCDIAVATETNTKGSVEISYAVTFRDVACRISALEYKEAVRILGDRIGSTVGFMITLPHDTTINATDRINSGGVTYEIVALENVGESWLLSRRAFLARVF